MGSHRSSLDGENTRVDGLTGTSHRIGWHGWQFTLPAQWNPMRTTGDARTGTLTLADLEQVRLELSWQGTRRPERVDLDRIRRAKRQAGVTWKPSVAYPPDHTFIRSRVGRDATGSEQIMLVSRRSNRILHARCSPSSEPPIHLERAPELFDDYADRASVPWSVFNMIWNVPARFHLKTFELTAGRLRFEFVHRGECLLFERTMLSRKSPQPVTEADAAWHHMGHALVIERKRTPIGWRIMGRPLTLTAEWGCSTSMRHFRVSSLRSRDEETLRRAVQGLRCHCGAAPEATP